MPTVKKSGSGCLQFFSAVRRHRATRMHVGIDQRRERRRRLGGTVEAEAELAGDLQVRVGTRSRR